MAPISLHDNSQTSHITHISYLVAVRVYIAPKNYLYDLDLFNVLAIYSHRQFQYVQVCMYMLCVQYSCTQWNPL